MISDHYCVAPDNFRNVEVGGDRLHALPDEVGLVRLLPVHVHLVLLRVDRHRPDAQLRARPEHPDGDLAAVGHQHAPDGADLRGGGGGGGGAASSEAVAAHEAAGEEAAGRRRPRRHAQHRGHVALLFFFSSSSLNHSADSEKMRSQSGSDGEEGRHLSQCLPGLLILRSW